MKLCWINAPHTANTVIVNFFLKNKLLSFQLTEYDSIVSRILEIFLSTPPLTTKTLKQINSNFPNKCT